MATKQELIDHAARKLRIVYEETVIGNGAYVKDTAMNDISDSGWNSIATWLVNREFDRVGRHLGIAVKKRVIESADAEASSMFDDDQLSLAEYARIEGIV